MQFATFLISLNGDTNNVVAKQMVSVPEAVALMASHGQHSVSLILGTVTEHRGDSPQVEHARLTSIYGEKPVEESFGKSTFNTRLPVRFSEVNIQTGEPPAPKEPKDHRTRGERAKGRAADFAIEEIEKVAKDEDDELDPEEPTASEAFLPKEKATKGIEPATEKK